MNTYQITSSILVLNKVCSVRKLNFDPFDLMRQLLLTKNKMLLITYCSECRYHAGKECLP